MRHCFDPCLVNDCFGDPVLYVDFRDERRAMLFDLGDISALAPRKLLRLSHVFVSHTHMDHFCGFDQLIRVVLGRKPRLVMVGPPGFIARVGHKLHAYTWNVVHRYPIELVIEVRELRADGTSRCASFSSRERFARRAGAPWMPVGDVLLDEPQLRVRGCLIDHGTPCMAYVFEEKDHVNIASNRLRERGLASGPWLRELRRAVLKQAPDPTPIRVQWRDRLGEHETVQTVGELRDLALAIVAGRRIGYVTDLCGSAANRAALIALLAGVDQLYIESVFLDADRSQARRKHHLTARQAGTIARLAGARAVMPFHFSPRYTGRSAELIAEVHAAWGTKDGRSATQ